MSVQQRLEKIDETVEVDIFEGGGSGFRDIVTDKEALLRDVKAWKENGPIESFEDEGDHILISVDEDCDPEMSGKFDQKFKNLYGCFPQGDRLQVRPH